MNIKIAVILCTIALQATGLCWGKKIVTRSPDGGISFIVHDVEDRVLCNVKIDGKAVIEDSPISITIDGKTFPGNPGDSTVSRELIDREITPTVSTISSRIHEFCNETLIEFGVDVSLRIRVYNDGAAYRWESRIDKEAIIVYAETLNLHFSDDYKTYFPVPNGNGFFSHQENSFLHRKLSAIDSHQKAACVPALFELGQDRYLLLTDVNVRQYPGLWLKATGEPRVEAVFPNYPAETTLEGDRNLKVSKRSDFLAKTGGTRAFPWRAFVLTNSKGLLTSTMLFTLADPCELKDTSWINPGKVAWDWFNDCNLTDVPFKAGINQKTYKHYIDFASANDLQYIILDEGWSIKGVDNLLNVDSDLDIVGLVEYGRARNVGVILWMTSTALMHNFDRAFDRFSEWGIKGLKVDFMQRDDQVMMDFCEKVARKAARHHLLVDFHGGSKPTGLQRTYPNVLTQESVLGMEQTKWSDKANPEMAVLLPFIRMVAGPMDYTPGVMDNFNQTKFRVSWSSPGSLGTRCHQLAMYVAYLSPLQMLADSPTKYQRNDECLPFLSSVPATWDQTVVLAAEVGDMLAVARRNGNTWFLGAMTNWNDRTLSLDLSFLGEGRYRIRYWADGPNAANTATDTAIGKTTVTAGTKLDVRLAPGGGFAAILEPQE